MKLVGRQGDSLVLALRPRDREQWVFLLRRYPVFRPCDHRLASPRDEEGLAAEQRVLEEALTEQHKGNRKLIEGFIQERLALPAPSDPNAPQSIRLTVTQAEVNWLLEILNDVRIGCWVSLGRPDEEQLHSGQLVATHPLECGAMELAAWVQLFLLGALAAPPA